MFKEEKINCVSFQGYFCWHGAPSVPLEHASLLAGRLTLPLATSKVSGLSQALSKHLSRECFPSCVPNQPLLYNVLITWNTPKILVRPRLLVLSMNEMWFLQGKSAPRIKKVNAPWFSQGLKFHYEHPPFWVLPFKNILLKCSHFIGKLTSWVLLPLILSGSRAALTLGYYWKLWEAWEVWEENIRIPIYGIFKMSLFCMLPKVYL